MAARGVRLAACLLAFACSTRPLAPDAAPDRAPARLAVDVYAGLGADAVAPAPTPEHVELVMDLTQSMLLPGPRGATRLARAHAAVRELIDALDARTEVSLRSVGHRAGDGCTASQRLTPGLDRADLDARLRATASRSEGSLAQTLDEVARDLEGDGASRSTRVVLLSDLDDACGGDLCAAAARLVERGAWLQVVPTGAVAAPACLTDLLPSPALPRASAPEAALFTVLATRSAGAPEIVAVGRAGAGFVGVPAGVLTLLVHLDPAERIGPFRLGPGDAARVRVLDDPGARRTWRLERDGEAVGRAFPPPETLPEEDR